MAKFSKVLGWLASPYFIGSMCAVAFAFFIQDFYQKTQDPRTRQLPVYHAFFQRLHNWSVDGRLRFRGPRLGHEDVAILTIDERALAKYGRWPWPRSQMAQVINDAMANGASTISFDIIFSEKQDALLKSLAEIEQKVGESLPENVNVVSQVFASQKQAHNHDQILSSTIEEHQEQLIMGAVYEEHDTTIHRPEDSTDYCHLAISKKNGVYDYWDNEGIIIGATDTKEIQFPPEWIERVIQHLQWLDYNTTKDWLAKKDSDLKNYFNRHQINADSEEVAALVTQLILQKKENYDEVLTRLPASFNKTMLSWRMLNSQLPKNKRVEIAETMTERNFEYCFNEFLTERDPLMPDIEKLWPTMTVDDRFVDHEKSTDEELAKVDFSVARDYIRFATILNPVKRAVKWLLNIPSIREQTVHTGAFNATQDEDGSIRRARLFVRTANHVQPNLAFKTFLVAKNLNATINFDINPYTEDPKNPDSKIVKDVDIFDEDGNSIMTIPTDIEGRVPINYAGPQKMFPYLSASEFLDDDDEMVVDYRRPDGDGRWLEDRKVVSKKEWVKDKKFIFGATATGIYDLRVTPFEENYPGVETHANMLDNLLRNDFLRNSKAEVRYMPFAVGIGGVAIALIISNLGAVLGLLISGLAAAAIIIFDYVYLFSNGILVNVTFALITLGFLYTFLTFFKYFTEERKKKQLKGTFQKYVSPAIVNEILKDPSKLELGGMKQEMTVFFSDVRGFTTISEKLDPRALSDLLNAYLTPMTEIIFENSGTLDKYMGDAIMAFFGAPITSEKHAAQACRASLIQIDKLNQLQKEWAEQKLPMIDIGIGLNTGDMSVGNMGSETVRNYTVMGDAVNLGSRLEGINKNYGTRIIISEYTQAHIENENFITREIDWVRVKGKNLPVRIFELIQEGDPDKELADMLTAFNKGFTLYHEREFGKAMNEFNAALSVRATDPVSQLYIDRCKDYLDNPPKDDWDGVFVMTTK